MQLTRAMKRAAVVLAGVLALSTLLASGGWRLSKSRDHQLTGDLLTWAPVRKPIVALTFDDGPHPIYTDSVLDLLDELEVKATFFVVGSAIERHPEVGARIRERGHELGNHSYSHARLVLKRPSTIRHEIAGTDSLIHALGQTGTPFVRPPYGARLFGLPRYLAAEGRPVVLWDLEPDSYHSDADGMVSYVSERVRPGSIILLHVEMPGRAAGRAALPRIVEALRAQGYSLVTLSELVRESVVEG